MKINEKILLFVFFVLIPVVVYSQSSTYGSIDGQVTDTANGEPLPGANIVVTKTLIGASSDLQGNYHIERIPPGSYQIKASMMGYKEKVVTVTVQPGQELTLNFQLEETVIESPGLIVTASKKAQSFQEVPNSVSLITTTEIERRNKTYLDQVLEYTPGVYLMEGDVNIRGSSGFSLGAGSRVLLLLDGIPMMPGDSGDIKWDVVPLSQIERVEIVKGAGSALYGSHALGGVINIITKDPTSIPKTEVKFAVGLYDKPYHPEWEWTNDQLYYSQVDVTHSQSWNKIGLLISGGRKESTGYRQNGDYEKYNLVGKLNYQITPQSSLTLQSNWLTSESGEIFLWRNQHDVYQMPIPSVGDWVDSKKYSVNAVYRQLVNSQFTYKIRSSYFYNDWEHHHHDNNDFSQAKKIGLEIQADYLPNEIHTFTFGIEAIYDITKSALFGHHDGYVLAGYVQDELSLIKNFAMTLGGRFDYHHVDNGVENSQFNPKLGLNYKPSVLTTFRASIGRGFRAPTMAEMFTETFTSGFKVIQNPNLKAEHAWSYEIGLNQIVNQHLMVDVALFYNEYKNFIEPEPDIYQTVQFINVANARIQGVELTTKTSLLKQFVTLDLGYTYMDAINLDTDEVLAYRPKHLFISGVNFKYSIFDAGLDFRYISRLERVKVYPKDDRVAQKVWDARIAANIFGYQLALNVNNLLQYNYLQIERNIAPMRNFVFSINKEF